MFLNNPSKKSVSMYEYHDLGPTPSAYKQIMTEFRRTGKSDTLTNMLELAVQNQLKEQDYQVLFDVVQDISDLSQGREAEKITREILFRLMRNSNRERHAAAGRSDARGSAPSKGSSADAGRNEAWAAAEQMMSEAKQIKSEAEAEAERIKRAAETESKRIKKEAEAQAKRLRLDVQEAVQSAKDGAMVQAERTYKDREQEFVPRAVKELVEEYRRDDAEVYRASDEERKKLIWDLEQEHLELCEHVKVLQADIISTLNNTQNNLCNYLTQWREAFYKKEVMGLAECCVDLHKILNNLDTQIAEAAANQQSVEQLGKIRKNLNRFAKRFRNAMLGVGLDVYSPAGGDRFDSAQHTLEGSDGEDYSLEGREIAGCRVPGVRMSQPGGSAKGFEPLIRAEITLKQEGSR